MKNTQFTASKIFPTTLAIFFTLTASLVSFAEESAAGKTDESTKAIRNFGWLVAQQTAVQMEFNADEISIFMEGYKDGASKQGGTPEDRQPELQAMSTYLQQRAEAIQAREASKQTELNQSYFTKLDKNPTIKKSESGLRYTILEAGEGTHATKEDSVKVHYKGTLTDGTVFDSSYDRGEPAVFPVSQVVPGFSEGVTLVGKGGKAQLHIPAALGYGEQVRPGGPIPPNAILIFDIEIIDILKN